MKKALSFAVALGLVAGMVSTATATTISGTARVRAVRSSNSVDAADAGQDKRARYDNRFRFMTKSQVADNVNVQTRIFLTDRSLGTTSSMSATDDNAVSGGDTHTHSDTSLKLDRAWITISDQPITGGTWLYGRVPVNWTPFWLTGASADRILAKYKISDAMTVIGFIQKSTEADNGNLDHDSDGYSLVLTGKAGDTKYKAIVYQEQQDQADASHNDIKGTKGDINVVAKAGPATIEAELGYYGGDLYENADNGSKIGVMAKATMALGDGITGVGLVAYAQGDYEADTEFAPSLLIGTSQVTGITNFGAHQATTAGSEDDALLVVAGANIKLSDASSITAGAGYYDMTSKAAGATGTGMSITEIDVAYNHNLAKNTNFKIGLGYGMPDNWSVADDAVYALGWQVTTKW